MLNIDRTLNCCKEELISNSSSLLLESEVVSKESAQLNKYFQATS